jgi:hypothetical protein
VYWSVTFDRLNLRQPKLHLTARKKFIMCCLLVLYCKLLRTAESFILPYCVYNVPCGLYSLGCCKHCRQSWGFYRAGNVLHLSNYRLIKKIGVYDISIVVT